MDNGLFDWSKNPKTHPWAEKAGPMAFLAYLRREVYRNMGACLSPHNAFLQTLGLETLELRLRKSSENALALAQRLVACPSVVDTPGEAACAELLHVYLRDKLGEAPGVELRLVGVLKPAPCHAVLTFLPAARATGRTLVLLGHFDTVGLEPYGPLADHAFDSARLKEHFSAAAGQGSELAGHAGSPDWAFGRGWLDMKGGVAAAVEVFLREAQRRELPANLVLLLTPDEESQSRGVRALIPELIELKERHGLELARIINADYTAPLSPGDDHRYLYSGTVGKLLLGVSVFGRTTHVGETFHGLNASALAEPSVFSPTGEQAATKVSLYSRTKAEPATSGF